MLVLCSNGLSSETLLAHVSSKMIGCKRATLVVTADNEYKEFNYYVLRCISELESLYLKQVLGLQEVHHGVAAASSKEVMRFLEKEKIQLNICPSSNVMLSVSKGRISKK